jgi:hypothetical protein
VWSSRCFNSSSEAEERAQPAPDANARAAPLPGTSPKLDRRQTMKRDFDLIRKIIGEVESQEAFRYFQDFKYEDYPANVVNEHIELLIEAGLIEGNVIRFSDGETGHNFIRRLTWAGHDFLESMRDDTIWKRVKETVIKPAGGIGFEILKEVLKKEARDRFGLPIP